MSVVAKDVFKACRILIPSAKVDIKKWPVIACDQFTSQRDYWDSLAKEIGDAPSTLSLILPEVYLEDKDVDTRIAAVNENMRRFLDEGLFEELEEGAVLTERLTSYSRRRVGLVLAVDLEAYSFTNKDNASVLPTEATVPERIPPRLRVRRGAQLELPHVMLLVNDRDNAFMRGLFDIAGRELYDTELLKNGGRIRGWFIEKDRLEARLSGFLEALAREHDGIVAAVGDGNHSLATAKALWEEKKKAGAPDNHPARYSLVELVSIHDEGLAFEPIHRLVFDADAKAVLDLLDDIIAKKTEIDVDQIKKAELKGNRIIISDGKTACEAELRGDSLAVELVQSCLDAHEDFKLDYTHGLSHTLDLTYGGQNTAIFLPPIAREAVFSTIRERKVFPRKSFSLGEAEEKRYYLEARRIDLKA